MSTEMTDIVGADYIHFTPRVTMVRWGGSPRNAQTITNALKKLGEGLFEVEQSRVQGSMFNTSRVPEMVITLTSSATGSDYTVRIEPQEWVVVLHASGRLIGATKLPRDADISLYTTAPTIQIVHS